VVVKTYAVDVNTSCTPEDGAHSPSWPNGHIIIITMAIVQAIVQAKVQAIAQAIVQAVHNKHLCNLLGYIDTCCDSSMTGGGM
jgi:hypothetical protein